MRGAWRYRLSGIGGVALCTALAVLLVNNAAVQSYAAAVPVLNRLAPDPPGTAEFSFELLTTLAVFLAAFVPLYRPRPRRILDTVTMALKRVGLAALVLAAVGYFDYTYRLPRFTLLLVTPMLAVWLPMWFAWIRRRPASGSERAVVVGDSPLEIEQNVEEADVPMLGYLCPTSRFRADGEGEALSDGGVSIDGLERLGGLSRLEDVLVSYDVDTAVLAFEEADRAEFFGALDACYEHGVDVKVHREHADSVLTAGGSGTLLDVEIEPWDLQDYVVKRLFDVVFSLVGLVVAAPVILVIAAAIKLDDGGSVFYRQARTAVFGETFDVYKFRTMVEDAEEETGAVISDEDWGGMDYRVTRVGRMLRQTHLDEIPQLWSVLKGDMSVVGPRPERPELDVDIQTGVDDWQKRWFVKPGLTGLAQVNDVTGSEPVEKIQYDLEYVKRQSFWFDIKVIIRQIAIVLLNLVVKT